MTDDKYNGWTNRETWAMALWLGNDEAMYRMAEGMKGEAREVAVQKSIDYGFRVLPSTILGDALKEWAEEQSANVVDGNAGHETRVWVVDVGSLYRVDWDEIGANLLSDDDQGNGDFATCPECGNDLAWTDDFGYKHSDPDHDAEDCTFGQT
jgi:hypothetical protein